jgi:hypothetical protein
VFFTTALTTGWDCPRAEVMMSFRRAVDHTTIAQLVGRMVGTPLARTVEATSPQHGIALPPPLRQGRSGQGPEPAAPGRPRVYSARRRPAGSRPSAPPVRPSESRLLRGPSASTPPMASPTLPEAFDPRLELVRAAAAVVASAIPTADEVA